LVKTCNTIFSGTTLRRRLHALADHCSGFSESVFVATLIFSGRSKRGGTDGTLPPSRTISGGVAFLSVQSPAGPVDYNVFRVSRSLLQSAGGVHVIKLRRPSRSSSSSLMYACIYIYGVFSVLPKRLFVTRTRCRPKFEITFYCSPNGRPAVREKIKRIDDEVAGKTRGRR